MGYFFFCFTILHRRLNYSLNSCFRDSCHHPCKTTCSTLAPIGRANLPESVAGAFEFSNERMNNPFLDDADSNNI